MQNQKRHYPRMSLSQIDEHVPSSLTTRLESRRSQEPDLNKLETGVLDKFSIRLLSGRGHVGEGGQQKEPLSRSNIFERFEKLDFNVRALQIHLDCPPVCKKNILF